MNIDGYHQCSTSTPHGSVHSQPANRVRHCEYSTYLQQTVYKREAVRDIHPTCYNLQSMLDELLYLPQRTTASVFQTEINDVYVLVLSFLDDTDLKTIFTVNKQLNDIGKDDVFWRDRIIAIHGKDMNLTNYLKDNSTHILAYKRLCTPCSRYANKYGRVVSKLIRLYLKDSH